MIIDEVREKFSNPISNSKATKIKSYCVIGAISHYLHTHEHINTFYTNCDFPTYSEAVEILRQIINMQKNNLRLWADLIVRANDHEYFDLA